MKNMKNVVIYSSPSCPYCIRAKQLFSAMNVPFKDIDLSADPKLAETLSEKYHWKTVPMIFIGETFVGGYDDLAALQQRGELAKLLAE